MPAISRDEVAHLAALARIDLQPAELDKLAGQLGRMATPVPQLNLFPTPDGARLAWKFYVFSRNPFGFFKYHVDAATGEVLYREDTVRYQAEGRCR